jgi:ABC-type multidrug transport system ATPase subunit
VQVFKTTAEDRVAVAGLDLTLYEGQITVLLGHNG